MNHKRSYLDSLNAGRQRRPSATLEQLNESLQNLEARLGRPRDEGRLYRDERPQAAPPAPPRAMAETPRPRAAAAPATAATPYRSLPRDYDRIRTQEEGVAAAGRIAGEIQALRDEIRQQMSGSMQREFEQLRAEVDRAVRLPAAGRANDELVHEMERISSAIQSMSERGDDRNLHLLRLEIDQVKRALDKLAREETVVKVDRRWDEFDRRWTDFERRVDARDNARDPEIAALATRLQEINDAVGNLPESLSLRSLEEKVRTLAGAIDHFVRQQEAQAPETFRLVEERLDEISRAIVASAATAQASVFDPEPFDRIEARITGLARQIDEIVEDRPNAEVIERLGLLSQRVDELAAQNNLPQRAVERLAAQITSIADRIDRAPTPPNPDELFQGIEQRFDVLSAMIERRQGDAMEQGNLLFRDLERRLDEVATRLDMRAADALDHREVMDAIDQRFSSLADRLADRSEADTSANAEAIRGMELRLHDISERLETTASQFAGIDPDLIRSLETQVSALSDHLNRPAAPLPELEDIGPRLDELERSISGSRDSILEAAREAAENAVRTFNGSQSHTAAVSGLAEDLRALESLTRRSDERNSRTFEAIHDTLIKIVDRLGTLDADDTETPLVRPKLSAGATPSIAPQAALADVDPRPAQPTRRSPSEAAAEAAVAAFEEDTGGARSLLGGLGRAMSRAKPAVEPDAEPRLDIPAAEDVDLSLDMPLDLKQANRPLEPGSGAPDLKAIMKRVREEKGASGAQSNDADAAKADFIAAARRAAQAAAAEAETLKRSSDAPAGGAGGRFLDMVRARRRPILMAVAAVVVALAGLQIGQSYIGAGAERQAAAIPLVAEKQAADEDDLVFLDGAEEASEGSTSDPAQTHATTPAIATVAPPAEVMEGPDLPLPAAPVVRSVDDAAPAPQAPAATAAAEPVAPAAVAEDAAAAVKAPSPEVVSLGIPVDAGPIALREAADRGDAKALFEVAARYAEGRGVKSDLKEAAKWYEKSAELGFAPAQYRIGNYFEKGMGVERDVAKSKTWYQLSAQQGNASAMHNLAVLYAMGADGTTDNESAVRWFRKAADLGVRDSQFNLGILAAKGVGQKQDLEESYRWFAIVARSGDRDAATKRDEIASSLRPEQLERARAAAESWEPQPLAEGANSVDVPDEWRESQDTTASVDMKKAIGNIQKILNKNGYEAGSADGVMGQKTRNAIIAFQKDNEMTATGEIDEPLVKALLARK